MRLTKTVDLTGATAAQLQFQLSINTEPAYDNVIVEAHTVGQDDWTTLPDLERWHADRRRRRSARQAGSCCSCTRSSSTTSAARTAPRPARPARGTRSPARTRRMAPGGVRPVRLRRRPGRAVDHLRDRPGHRGRRRVRRRHRTWSSTASTRRRRLRGRDQHLDGRRAARRAARRTRRLADRREADQRVRRRRRRRTRCCSASGSSSCPLTPSARPDAARAERAASVTTAAGNRTATRDRTVSGGGPALGANLVPNQRGGRAPPGRRRQAPSRDGSDTPPRSPGRHRTRPIPAHHEPLGVARSIRAA